MYACKRRDGGGANATATLITATIGTQNIAVKNSIISAICCAAHNEKEGVHALPPETKATEA
jgi:hypothetical protein